LTDATSREAERFRGRDAGRLSSSFHQPVGSQFEPGRLGGYYIDFRVKVESPQWPPASLTPLDEQLWVDSAQWGLGCYEHYLAGAGDEWLQGALACGRHMVERQRADGGWVHGQPYPHTFPLDPPWLSAMAQGEGASLLLRLHRETGEERLAEAALRALRPYEVPSSEGGVQALLDGRPFPEEYPTDPPSFVLNGGIFALWGLYDAGLALGDAEAERGFRDGIDTLAASIDRWDTGWWTRYDLFPHLVPNVASPAYHTLHIDQLDAMQLLEPRPELARAAERWRGYAASRMGRRRAFAAKVVFRLAVPRNRLLARRMPWGRR
jgi:heparosan-N-sulfate-glucuronate 5-epimerase